MIESVFLLWSPLAVVTAMLSGIGWGITLLRLRPASTTFGAILLTGTLFAIWFTPVALSRLANAETSMAGYVSIGSYLLSVIFTLTAGVVFEIGQQQAAMTLDIGTEPRNVCIADGCYVRVDRTELVCREHFLRLPEILRAVLTVPIEVQDNGGISRFQVLREVREALSA